jgi:hypothetical protein
MFTVDGVQVALTLETLDEEPDTLLMPPQAASVINRQGMPARRRKKCPQDSPMRWRLEFAIAIYLYSNCGPARDFEWADAQA